MVVIEDIKLLIEYIEDEAKHIYIGDGKYYDWPLPLWIKKIKDKYK